MGNLQANFVYKNAHIYHLRILQPIYAQLAARMAILLINQL